MYFDVKEYKPHPFPNAISGSVIDITSYYTSRVGAICILIPSGWLLIID